MTNTINIKEARDAALVKANSPLNVHDNLKGLSIPELQELSLKDRNPWHTLCLNVTGDLNVGTMIRTSHCLGAKSVIVFGRQRIDNRSLVGAGNYITVEKIPACDDNLNLNLDIFVEVLKQKKLMPIFVEGGENSVQLTEYDFDHTITSFNSYDCEPCLVMGNETDGIPQHFLDYFTDGNGWCDLVSIPQKGVIRSLNVAVAHGIVASYMCNEIGWM